jgi:GNAT superfamily N-acetyltransferase
MDIRPATAHDVPQILQLIRGLAAYEKLSHQVVATEERLRQTLFCERPAAEAALVWSEGRAVGLAVYFHNYSTFRACPGIYLEDLFVEPAHRGKGCGKALLLHLAKLAVERGCDRLDWAVLDWNVSAIEFYEGLGARMHDDWRLFRAEGAALRKMAGS